MAVYRWEAGRDVLFIRETMSELFEYALGQLKLDIKSAPPWAPPCDVYEDPENYIIKAEVPGAELNDIILEINDRSVLLAGERKRRKEVSEENYHRVERSYGRFARSFVLPGPVRAKDVSASLEEGVLTVTIPKEKSRGKGRIIRVDAE